MTQDSKPKRDSSGRLLPGQTANPKGRPPMRGLGEAIRRIQSNEDRALWLLKMSQGIDPDSPKGVGYTPIDISTRMDAFKLLLVYAEGTPSKRSEILEELAKERALENRHPIDSIDVAALEREDRERFRRAMRILTEGKDPNELVDVIDPPSTVAMVVAGVPEPGQAKQAPGPGDPDEDLG